MNDTIDVRSIAALAKLKLSDSEAERLEREMRSFADFARSLDKYGDKSYSHAVIDEYGREDNVSPHSTDISGFSNSVSDGYITVPLTVEGE